MLQLERRGETLAYTIKLNAVRDFFVAPTPDPFAEMPMYRAGIEYLADALRPRGFDSPLHIIVAMPTTEAITADELRYALEQYCRQRIVATTPALSDMRWAAIKTVQMGVFLLVVWLLCWWLAEDQRELSRDG